VSGVTHEAFVHYAHHPALRAYLSRGSGSVVFRPRFASDAPRQCPAWHAPQVRAGGAAARGGAARHNVIAAQIAHQLTDIAQPVD